MGATLVAIIGGLLVSRYVALASARDGADARVHELEGSLRSAEQAYADALSELRQFDLLSELDDVEIRSEVRTAVLRNETMSLQRARRMADLDEFTDEEVERELDAIHSETKHALRTLIPLVPKRVQHPTWSEFRRERDFPILFDDVWREAYRDISKRRREEARKEERLRNDLLAAIGFANIPPTSLSMIRPSFDARADSRRRLEGRLDDARAQLATLRLQHQLAVEARSQFVQPRGLISGVLVLAVLTLVSVVWPLLLLAPQPATLTKTQSAWLLSIFCCSLILLFAYIAWLAAGLREPASHRPSTADR